MGCGQTKPHQHKKKSPKGKLPIQQVATKPGEKAYFFLFATVLALPFLVRALHLVF